MKDITVEEILAAIEADEICGYYQPKYDATTGELTSAEILARWIKPDGEVVSPADFIPQLELSDAINKLDWHMARKACRMRSRSLTRP